MQQFHFPISQKNFDILVIGAGGAGLVSAISASNSKAEKIAVISKVLPTSSHTVAAKGGINASLGNVSKDDWQWHAFDTIKGSDYLADNDAVEILCRKANEAILFLEQNGVIFSRDEHGKIAQRAYGGQTTNFGNGDLAFRACYSKDKTGHSIIHTLYQQALKRNIQFFSEFFVVELLIENNQCYGCIALDCNQGEIVIFTSKTTILASGGYSQIYRNTTSSLICTGDGTALAFKSGLALQDMEFVQFHPTGIFGQGFLITEAARSEGAYLLNKNHERFMLNYAPKLKELASRDVISLAMATEILEGRAIEDNFLYLDMRHLADEILTKKLPGVVDLVRNFTKRDVKKDLIPVAPSAHYSMGGVPCNTDCEVIEGLMAVGEAACLSVHGANRLGCNSLLDLIVFGLIAGKKASELASQKPNLQELSNDFVFKIAKPKLAKFAAIFDKKELNFKSAQTLSTLKNRLQSSNDKNLAVIRNRISIEKSLQQIHEIHEIFQNYRLANCNLIWNEELISYLELENLLLNSLAVATSALNRIESRGAHFRSDFAQRDDVNFLAHSLVNLSDPKTFKTSFSLKPVHNSSQISALRLSPQLRKY